MVEEGEFRLPKVHHIGVAVKDVEKAAEFYTDSLGIGPFMFIDVDLPEVTLYRKPTPLRLKVGMAQMGDTLLELIQALDEGSPPWNLVYRKGEGLYHLGFLVDDIKHALNHLEKKGFSLIEEGGHGENKFAFVSCEQCGDVIFELMQLEPGLIP
ncbi:MAG: VOC family protein [Dehalococcoidia bacterium]|nr:MAG: VOC family protein [Dehalococcoidia bacterium]